MLTAKEVALEVTKALDSKKGIDIKLLRIEKVSSLADYFLICTGTSNTHVKTLCDYAEYTMVDVLGEPMLGREGHRGNSWELLDFGSVVVHVFTDEARKFYDLERLCATAAAHSSERNLAKTSDFAQNVRGVLVVDYIYFIIASVCLAKEGICI